MLSELLKVVIKEGDSFIKAYKRKETNTWELNKPLCLPLVFSTYIFVCLSRKLTII